MLSTSRFLTTVLVTGFLLLASSQTYAESLSCLGFYRGYETRVIQAKANSTLQSLKDTKSIADTMDSQFAKSQIEARLNPPIQMSFENASFRRDWLPKITTDKSKREQIMRLVEAELRLSSTSTLEKIKNEKTVYDVIIVGGGVHGIITASTMKANNPGLKILIVEKQDTIGSRFRTGGSVFVLNSSQRPSGKNKLPLPGEGNLNELPYLPIQVTDLSAQKYPPAKDLGDAILMGAYSLSKMQGVDIVLNTTSETLNKSADQAQVVLFSGNKRITTLTSQTVVRAPGLGLVKLPDEVKSFVQANPEYMTSKTGELPRVSTYDQALEILEGSNNPKSFFEKKRVMIAGKGNSADTIVEFIIGNNGQFGLSSAQIDLPAKILWAGQDKKTCDEFLKSARLRYSSVGSIFRSSKANGNPIGEALPAKVVKVDKSTDPNQVDVTMDDGKVYTVDTIILATGLEARTTNEALADYQVISDRILNSDKDSKVALFNPDKNEYLVGPGAPGLVETVETKGIVQNTVAIFNHAPRVVALSERLAREIVPNSDVSSETTQRSVSLISSIDGVKTYRVTDISPIRPTRFEDSKSYLELVFKRALDEHYVNVKDAAISIEMSWDSKTNSVIVSSKDLDVKLLIQSLAKTKDFFNLAGIYLRSDSKTKFVLTASETTSILSIEKNENPVPPHGTIQNIANMGRSMFTEIAKTVKTFIPRTSRRTTEPLLEKEAEAILQRVVSVSVSSRNDPHYTNLLQQRIAEQFTAAGIPYSPDVLTQYLRQVISEVTGVRYAGQTLEYAELKIVREFSLEHLFVKFTVDELNNINKGINIFKNVVAINKPRANYRLNETLFRRQVQASAQIKNPAALLIQEFATKLEMNTGILDAKNPQALDSYVYAFTVLKNRFPTEFQLIEFGEKTGLVVFNPEINLSAESLGQIYRLTNTYLAGPSDLIARRIMTRVQQQQQRDGYRYSHETTLVTINETFKNDGNFRGPFLDYKLSGSNSENAIAVRIQALFDATRQ